MKEFEGMPLRWRKGTKEPDNQEEDAVPFAGLYEKTYTKNGKQIRYLEGDVVRMGDDALKVIILPIALKSETEKGEIAGTLFEEVAEAKKQELLDWALDQMYSDDDDAAT
jgi:hypothetical protein